MILYNIRANGPFEYDKFILNIGQLHNEVLDMHKEYQKADINEQDDILSSMVKQNAMPLETYGHNVYNKIDWYKPEHENNPMAYLLSIKRSILAI